MALEVGTHIDDLNQTNPASTDGIGQADDHIRLIKKTILNTFPNITGPVLATQAELNFTDGLTSSTAELNTLDGYTGDVSDFNKLAGVTASSSELSKLAGVTASTSEINKLDGLNTTTSELNTMAGITASTSELNKIDGYTGNSADLSILAGASAAGVSSTEFRRLNGVTSNIQTQLNALPQVASPTFTGRVTVPTLNATSKVELGAWSIQASGADLVFAYNGTSRFRLTSTGNLTVEGDVTAFGAA